MIRNLKALGLLTVAALAMSAMVASAAQATNGIITSGRTPGTHTGAHFHIVQEGPSTENFFEQNGVRINCPNAQVMLTGKTTGTDASLTVTPTYEGKCGTINETNDAVNELVTVTMNGCTYTLNQPIKLEPDTYKARLT